MVSLFMFGFTSVRPVRESRPLLTLTERFWSFQSGGAVCVFVLKASFGVHAVKRKPFKVIGNDIERIV